MDSTRGGPLTTLILMLPLIVVPALVVLRPPERDSGYGSGDLSAADRDRIPAGADEFDSMFGATVAPVHNQGAAIKLLDEPLSNREPVDDVASELHRGPQLYHEHQEPPPISDSGLLSRRIPDLTRWGVTKSIWFTPGNSGAVGFAAFVPSQDGRIRYRFSAVGREDGEVIQDVVRQIEIWQSAQTVTTDGRSY